MQIEQSVWNGSRGWRRVSGNGAIEAPQFVLYFGAPGTLESGDIFSELRLKYPDAHLVGCTTGGEIAADEALDDSVVAAAVKFERTEVRLASATVEGSDGSRDAGRRLGKALDARDLQGIFVLSDGTRVNGTELVRGITETVAKDIPLTGGLAGDGPNFGTTLVGGDEIPREGRIVAVGFHGSALSIGHGSVGGWDVVGPERVITRSEGNVLYELDGKPALDLYKTYLGDQAADLPGSALLFPLKVRPSDDRSHELVRTIVGIDEDAKSMIFAGSVPQSHIAQLMMGNFENLIEGAAEAAEIAVKGIGTEGKLAVLISCIGRKLLLGQRIGEEVEAVTERLGGGMPQIGFYSYGEISPHATSGICDLHNQTMTITVFAEN